ncbi:spore germination protein [Pullulanibacillus pueri]|uniref:Germination protein YpeB n=1 Tax=Pullulanibacillus pueri TaxID=1437324 RepID=A0A8J2ZUD9_9BACL|nr:germination protein YpeB [Pullulanibacillus pueri]MBM7681484.1 spore germination protein [Pullulanibacillus pueri]GGH79064.1 germination protein YpeB [Pullulanibacillus pueri]
MGRNIVIAVLVVALISTGYWGYLEHKDKNVISTNAENNYQQAYHNLTYYVDNIHDHLGTTLGTSSKDLAAPELTEVWRMASLARGEIGQLPVTLLPFNKTQEFLSNLGKFSFQTAIKSNNGKLSDDEYKQLQNLYNQSEEIETDLRQVQKTIVDNHLKWMDVEVALASQKQPNDNQVIDGLKAVNQKVEGFQNEWGPAIARSNLDELSELNKLDGPTISKEQAGEAVKNFLNIKKAQVQVRQLGKGSGYKAYNVTINQKASPIVASVTQKGGDVVSFIKHRDVGSNKLSLNDAVDKANKFLKSHGFNNMKVTKTDQYNNVGVLTYVLSKGDVFLYPSSIRIKVALDNGEVLGFDDKEYLVHKDNRLKSYKPKIKAAEAEKGLSQNLDIKTTDLAVYENELGEEVLCYSFLGTRDKDTYRVFVNANTGQQEKVELLTA